MKISTQVQAPAHLTTPVPSGALKAAVMAAMSGPVENAVSQIKAANPKVAGTYFSRPIDLGNVFGYGIGSTWPKWWVLEYDMKPHTITARNAPYLVFEGRDGHLVRTKSVRHPGHKGNNAVYDAVEVAAAQIRAALPGAVTVVWYNGEVR